MNIMGRKIRRNNQYYYNVFCKICGLERWTTISRINAPTFTGLCSKCNCKSRRGDKHHNWKGGHCISTDGYVLVYAPEHSLAEKRGYVKEHRLVAAEKWGIETVRGKNVHHIDGNKANNSIENLELWGVSNSPEDY